MPLEEFWLACHGEQLADLTLSPALPAGVNQTPGDSLPSMVGMHREAPHLGKSLRIPPESTAADDLAGTLGNEK
ncbi:MAG: hypothetical protein OXC19_22120 [Bryobacterales bacterium]|nr:hypothetical protein [Bryobacterales bacterium]